MCERRLNRSRCKGCCWSPSYTTHRDTYSIVDGERRRGSFAWHLEPWTRRCRRLSRQHVRHAWSNSRHCEDKTTDLAAARTTSQTSAPSVNGSLRARFRSGVSRPHRELVGEPHDNCEDCRAQEALHMVHDKWFPARLRAGGSETGQTRAKAAVGSSRFFFGFLLEKGAVRLRLYETPTFLSEGKLCLISASTALRV